MGASTNQYTANKNFSDPAGHAAALTLHDTNELAYYSRGLYVGGAGNLKVTTVNGEAVTFVGVPAGTILPVRAKIVWSTGSTATSVVALW